MGQKKSFQLNRNRYEALKKQYTKIIHRSGLKKDRRSVIDHYYDLPVQEKTVLLCGLGRNINGSLKYLLDELNHSSRFEGFRIYVRTTAEQTDASVNDHIKEYGWTRTETVPKKYDMMMETCQYLLTESWFPYQYIKRPEQTLINIWHGTPLKRLEIDFMDACFGTTKTIRLNVDETCTKCGGTGYVWEENDDMTYGCTRCGGSGGGYPVEFYGSNAHQYDLRKGSGQMVCPVCNGQGS